ncbi:hypothetical protein ABI069_15085, partial [Enterococcus faecium]|uniref:hypothetical protein n=1 Tax=Enterococcus faecium TaxID=1352 RepID=UPI003F42BF25
MTTSEAARNERLNPTAAAATTAPTGGGIFNYNVQMLQEDRTLTMPSNTWFYYFKVMPGVKMAHDGQMTIV